MKEFRNKISYHGGTEDTERSFKEKKILSGDTPEPPFLVYELF